MNVLIANDFGSINGGTSQVAITEALGLAERGHHVIFFYSAAPLDNRLLDHENILPIQVDDFELLSDPNRIHAALKGIWNRQAARKIDQVISGLSSSDSLVHLHGWSKALSPSIGKIILKHNLPFIFTLHDYFIACPNGGFYNYQKEEICPLRALSPACLVEHCDRRIYMHKLWRFLRTFIQKYIANVPNPRMVFIAVSKFSEQILSPYLPKTAFIHHLPNPIQVPLASPVPITKNKLFTFIGRLSSDKGPLLLAQANQDREFPLAFIGKGDLSDTIRAMDETALLTGWLEQEAMFRQLDQARALVFPTRGYETFGLVVREAASRGVPAIVSDTCAATEWVEDGVNGLWFKCGDASDLRDKMNMLQDNNLLSRLGSAAYHRFWDDPSLPERHTDNLLAIYSQILAQKAP